MKPKQILVQLSLYSLWILLAVLAGIAAFQLHALLLYVGILVVQTPSLRPVGWNTGTVSGLNRCYFLVLGALWLGLVIFMERHLRDAALENRLLNQALWLGLIIATVFGLSWLALYLLS